MADIAEMRERGGHSDVHRTCAVGGRFAGGVFPTRGNQSGDAHCVHGDHCGPCRAGISVDGGRLQNAWWERI